MTKILAKVDTQTIVEILENVTDLVQEVSTENILQVGVAVAFSLIKVFGE